MMKLPTALVTFAAISPATPATTGADPTDDGYDNIFGLVNPDELQEDLDQRAERLRRRGSGLPEQAADELRRRDRGGRGLPRPGLGPGVCY